MDIPRAYMLMVTGFVVLAEVVSKVFLPRVPLYVVVIQGDLICHPEKSHLHRARAVLLDCVVGNAGGSVVIAVDGGGGLVVAHFLQS